MTIMFSTFLFMPILLLTDEVLALKTTQHVKHVVCCHFNRASQGNSHHTLNNNSGFSLLGLAQAVKANVTGCFVVWLSSQHAMACMQQLCQSAPPITTICFTFPPAGKTTNQLGLSIDAKRQLVLM